MNIPIKIIFQNQQERYTFFQDLFGKNYSIKMNTPMETIDGITISIEPYTIFESEVEIPSNLQFYLNIGLGYGIVKISEWLYLKIKERKINSAKIGEKDIEKKIDDIAKAIKDLEDKLEK